MKKQVLVLTAMCVILSSYAQDQYKIIFGYDSAGNQTSQNMVCVNCNSDKVKENDSIIIQTVTERDDISKNKIDESSNSAIFAYPNPVTNVLRVAWIETNNKVQNVAIFSWSGQRLISTTIKPTQLTVDLSFSQYPPGMYIVVILYDDATRESFQIIKK